MNPSIGIDVGGTFIKGGRVGNNGALLEEVNLPTEADQGPDHVVEQIIHAARKLSAHEQCAGIGIGTPGLISPDRNTVKFPPNLPGWTIISLASRVTEATGLPAVVDNDANCAAIGEAAFGAGRDVPDFILATLGTGVGGGIIINGKIFRGSTGGAGEIGHTTIDYNGPQCNCGSFGCVETYIGNKYFVGRVARALVGRQDSALHGMLSGESSMLTPEVIAQAADRGDAFAREQLNDAGYMLGVGLANVIGLFDIHTVILGGGIAQAGELIFSGARRAIIQFSQPPIAESFTVLPAMLGNAAGVLGASQLFLQG